MIFLMWLALTGNVHSHQFPLEIETGESYIYDTRPYQTEDMVKLYLAAYDECDPVRRTMTEVLSSKPEYWKRRFKRAIRGELFENNYLYGTNKVKVITEQAASYGIDLR